MLTVAKPMLCPQAQGKAAVPAPVGLHSLTQNKPFPTVVHFFSKVPAYLSTYDPAADHSRRLRRFSSGD